MAPTIEELEKEITLFQKNISESNALMSALSNVVSVTKSQTSVFEKRTAELQLLIGKLPPEVGGLFDEKIASLIKDLQLEYKAYQDGISSIVSGYLKKLSETENRIIATVSEVESKIVEAPAVLDRTLNAAQTRYAEELAQAQAQHNERFHAFEKQLTELQEKLCAFSPELKAAFDQSIAAFMQEIAAEHQEHQAAITSTMSEYAKTVLEVESAITGTPAAIRDEITDAINQAQVISQNTQQKYSEQLSSATESYISRSDLCMKQLTDNYAAFISKLESTNVDQIYRLCQNMNRSINTKLNIAIGGAVVAIVLSIVSLLI